MTDEVSAGGSQIFRHEAPRSDSTPQFSGGDDELIGAIDCHLHACFGAPVHSVFHEIVSLDIHVDIHQVAPSDQFPFWRLVTSGMAERPMTFPEGYDGPTFAELTIALPQAWEMPQAGEAVGAAFQDERVYWPIRLLKMLARLPHDYNTFIWYDHTIPNGDPPAPYADNVGFCGAMIVPPILAPKEFHTVETPSGKTIRILGILPLYEAEMRLKLESGADALIARLDEFASTDLVDPARPNVAY